MGRLLFHSCWILGLALLLASFSYYYQQALEAGRPLRRQLNAGAFEGLAWISLTLIALGAAGTSRELWEAALWILMTAIAAFRAATFWYGWNRGVEEQ